MDHSFLHWHMKCSKGPGANLPPSRNAMKALLRNVLVVAMSLGAVSLYSACSSDPSEGESGEDAITGTKCKIFNNQTGKPITLDELKKLNDPVAKKFLAGGECPRTYDDVLKKAKTTDGTKCKDI